MKKFGAIGAILLCSIFATEILAESTSPPKNLKQLGENHWTPWDPPEPGPGDYIIQRGDTLWDLAGEWLGDPFLWPLVWDANRYILDSHWIYPGDPLKVPGEPTIVPIDGPPDVPDTGESGDTGDTGTTAESEPLPLVPVADPVDMYCSGYIDPAHEFSALRIAGHELEKRSLGQGDVIYLNQGRDTGIQPGSEWSVVRLNREVMHPATQADLGDYVRRMGKVRVMAVQENTSLAVIEMSCEDIHDNDELVPWSDLPIPRMTAIPSFDRYDLEPSGRANGYVVAVKDDISAFGQGHIIHVDLGDNAGVKSGEMVTLFRDNGSLPRLMLGQAVVLTSEPETSTLRITDSVREIEVGDRAELR